MPVAAPRACYRESCVRFTVRLFAVRLFAVRSGGTLSAARRSLLALALSVAAWATGCATGPKPAIEPAFAARTYTPIRIALLPPDLFLVVDQVGDNDPAQSEALRQTVHGELVRFATEALRTRGYDLDLTARWDGIVGRDGAVLVSRDELGWMANSILQFANGPAGGRQGPLVPPEFVAPEMAAKIGWATQSDALLYVNLKGVTTTNGKRTAQIVGSVLIVVVVAALILALAASRGDGGGRGGNNGGSSGLGGMKSGRSVVAPPTRGAPGMGSAARPSLGGGGGAPTGALRPPPPVGRGLGPARGRPGRVYGSGGPHVGIGVGIYVPLVPGPVETPVEGSAYTHDGAVTHEDEIFGGDELYLSMTLVNAADGRVLWHLREELDLDAEDPADIRAMMDRVARALPMRGDLAVPAAAPSSAKP